MARTTAGAYRPRHPERTVLYRVLAQHFERFLQVYDERFAERRGPLSPGAQQAVHRYLDCGIFESGFARVHCGECGHDFFVAFSCKLRCICPSCHIKRELLWAQWAAEELLEDVPHRQLVFTIPKRLRPYFRYDRTLLGDLAGCAWRAHRIWILATLGDDTALPGAIGFIQTAGELLNFHPHVHLLITDGVLEPDGTFERLPYPHCRQLERLFRAELLRLLLNRGLISQELVENLLSWRHSGFSVHADVHVADRVSAARLGRYMIRCPLVLERMSLDEDTGEVLYRTRPWCGTGATTPTSPGAGDAPPPVAERPFPTHRTMACALPSSRRSPSAAAPDSPGPPSSDASTRSTRCCVRSAAPR